MIFPFHIRYSSAQIIPIGGISWCKRTARSAHDTPLGRPTQTQRIKRAHLGRNQHPGSRAPVVGRKRVAKCSSSLRSMTMSQPLSDDAGGVSLPSQTSPWSVITCAPTQQHRERGIQSEPPPTTKEGGGTARNMQQVQPCQPPPFCARHPITRTPVVPEAQSQPSSCWRAST